MTSPGEPSLGEIGRRLGDLHQDLRALRTELVRQDVYDANRQTVELRIKAVEEDLNQIRANGDAVRRLVYGALLTAAGTAAVQVITAYANTR